MINKILKKFGLRLSSVKEIEDKIKLQYDQETVRLLQNPIVNQKEFQLLQDNPMRKDSKLLKGRFWYIVKCVSLLDQKFVWHINLRMVKVKGMSIKSPDVFMKAEHQEATGLLNDFIANKGGGNYKRFRDKFAYYCHKPLTDEELEVLEFFNPKIAKLKIQK